jgi:putative hemolysin
MGNLLGTLALMLVLVLANGLFAAAEIAVVSVRRSRIRHLAEEGDARAKAVDKLHGQAEQFLATIQIGITLLSVAGAALGGAAVAAPIAEVLREVPLASIRSAADQIALVLVIAGFSFFSMVLGELIPKSIALRWAEPLALTLGRPLLALGALARPAVWFLTSAANLFLKPLRDRTTFTETRLTAEEIKILVGDAIASGAIERRRAEIIERAVDFGELTVADVMIPRQQIVAIDLKDPTERIQRVLLEQGHTRMPVLDGSIDKVIGYVTAKDILSLVGERELVVLKDIVRPAFFVPTPMRAVDLLRELQKRHEHLAIVVDEYGGTAGLCTTEDLVEEIVGEIFSEDTATPELIKPGPQGTSIISAVLPVREFNRAFNANVPEDVPYDTLAGLLTHLAGTIPTAGQSFVAHGFEFTVTERTERRVKQVRVRRVP